MLVFVRATSPSPLLLTRDKAALFASFLSAFLIYFLPKLQSESGDLTVELLMHISLQLQNVSTPAYEKKPFAPQQGSVLANALFMGSLSFLLLTAFLSMLVKGWIRDFDRNLPPITVAEERARERERRMRSLIHWRLPQLVAWLPVLTQIALILFCVGIILFLRDVHSLIANVTGGFLGLGLLIYITTTLISICDPFSPFPSPISRVISGLLPRIGDGIRRRWTNLCLAWARATPYTNHGPPLLTAVIDLFKRLKFIFSSENEVAGTETETPVLKITRNLSDNLHIMNYLGDVTLVAPENIATFLAVIKQVGSLGEIQPTRCPRWFEILTLIYPSLHKISDPEVWQGLVRITAQSIEVDLRVPLHQDILWEMSRGLSKVQGSELITTRLSTLFSDVEDMMTSVSTWNQACFILKEAKVVGSIAIELLWIAEFLHTSLFSALDGQTKQHLASNVINTILPKSLAFAVIFPSDDGLLIVNAALKAALALASSAGLQDGQKASKPNRQASLSRQGRLFKLGSFKGMNDPVDLEQVMSILRSATKQDSAFTRIPILLFFAFHNVDPSLTLYSSGNLEPLTNHLIDIDDQASVPGGTMVSHRYLLEAFIKRVERKRTWIALSQIVKFYDMKVRGSTELLNVEMLGLIEMSIRWLIMDDVDEDHRLSTELRDELNDFAFHNRWLALHWNNEAGSSNLIETEDQVLALSKMDWVGHPAYERIARRTMELYDSRPQPHLLKILFPSSCFYTSFSALAILAVDDSNDVESSTQLEYLRKALARLFGGSQVASLDDWLVIDSSTSVAWETFSPEWRSAFISTWRSHEWVQWIHSVSVQLKEKLGLATDSSPILAQAPQQNSAQAVNQELQDASSRLLPFVLRILDGCDPPITAHEALSLRRFHILDLPDAFGDAHCKARIASLLSTRPAPNPGTSIHSQP